MIGRDATVEEQGVRVLKLLQGHQQSRDDAGRFWEMGAEVCSLEWKGGRPYRQEIPHVWCAITRRECAA